MEKFKVADFVVEKKNGARSGKPRARSGKTENGSKIEYEVSTRNRDIRLRLGYYIPEKGERHVQIDAADGDPWFKKIVGRKRLTVEIDPSGMAYCFIRKTAIKNRRRNYVGWELTTEEELSALLGSDFRAFMKEELGASDLLLHLDPDFKKASGLRYPLAFFSPDNIKLPIGLFILTRVIPLCVQLRSMS
jgi:hypothetical protein